MSSVIRIQTMIRVMIARKRARAIRDKVRLSRGRQPLKGKVVLKMEILVAGGQRELTLTQTTPHRRRNAAVKIQARIRGILVRKRLRPIIMQYR